MFVNSSKLMLVTSMVVAFGMHAPEVRAGEAASAKSDEGSGHQAQAEHGPTDLELAINRQVRKAHQSLRQIAYLRGEVGDASNAGIGHGLRVGLQGQDSGMSPVAQAVNHIVRTRAARLRVDTLNRGECAKIPPGASQREGTCRQTR